MRRILNISTYLVLMVANGFCADLSDNILAPLSITMAWISGITAAIVIAFPNRKFRRLPPSYPYRYL